jgi:hypothetical protein
VTVTVGKRFLRELPIECYLDNWILPRWGELKLDQIKPVAVEEWLDGIKRAKATRAKIRNLMSALFHHAMRYEWTDKIRSSSCVRARSGSAFLMFSNSENFSFFSPNSIHGNAHWFCWRLPRGFV